MKKLFIYALSSIMLAAATFADEFAAQGIYIPYDLNTLNRLRDLGAKDGGVKFLKQELAKGVDISHIEGCTDVLIIIWNNIFKVLRINPQKPQDPIIVSKLNEAKEIIDIILQHPKVSKQTLHLCACQATKMVDGGAMLHIINQVQRSAEKMGEINYVAETKCPADSVISKLITRFGNQPREEANVEALTSWRNLSIEDQTLFDIDQTLAYYITGNERRGFWYEEFKKNKLYPQATKEASQGQANNEQ